MPIRPWTPEPREEEDRRREEEQAAASVQVVTATADRNVSGTGGRDTNNTSLSSAASSPHPHPILPNASTVLHMSSSGDEDVDMDDTEVGTSDLPGHSHYKDDVDLSSGRGANLERRSGSELASGMEEDVPEGKKDEETEVERSISVDKGKGRADESDGLTWYLPDRLRRDALQSIVTRLQKNAALFWRNQQNANMILVIPTPGSSKRLPPRPSLPQHYPPTRHYAPSQRDPYYPYPPDPRVASYWGPSPYPYSYWPPAAYGYGQPPLDPRANYDYPTQALHTPSPHSRREQRRLSASPTQAVVSTPSSRAKAKLASPKVPEPTRATPEATPGPGDRSPSPKAAAEKAPPAFPLRPTEPASSSSASRESPYALRPEYPAYQQSGYAGYDYWYGDSAARRSSAPSERIHRPVDDDDGEETITYHVHKEFLLTQSSLIRFLYSEIDPNAPKKEITNPIDTYSFKPSPSGPYHLERSSPQHPRLHLDLPDPDSFGQILEWLYFGPVAYPHLEEAMHMGRVTWGGLVRNAEWLGLSAEFKTWLGKHWKKSMEAGKTEKDLGNKPIASSPTSPAAGAKEKSQSSSPSAEPEGAKEGEKAKAKGKGVGEKDRGAQSSATPASASRSPPSHT